MFGASFSVASSGATWDAVGVGRAALGALLAGAAIKLVDAAVDEEAGWDAASCAAYTAALLAVGAAVHLGWAGSLMAAAWGLGMLGHYGLRGRLEGGAVAAAAGALLGWSELVGSLLALLAVQLADRWADREGWPASLGPKGQAAAALVVVGLLAAAAGVDALKAGLVLLLTPAAEAVAALLGRRRPALSGVSWVWSS